jgi:retron-type reverse transcriptase
MHRLEALKATTSRSGVAKLLAFEPGALSYILYKQPEVAKYTTFQIPKRNGGQRTIKAPIDALKLVQSRLSDLLQDCVDEININRGRKDRVAHGFKRKRSIITNAKQHRNRRYVFNLDLEEFFPSINFGRVRGFFIHNRDFELHQDVATTIAQIGCHDNSLPQGSPCSPVISNLIAHILDMRLVKLASAVGCTYSRYADDLTFSTSKKEFPVEICAPSETDAVAQLWRPGREVQRIIERTGFRINVTKTHLMYRDSRQEVTGLVVNQKINVRREYRHNVRAMVYNLIKTGAFDVYGTTHKDTTPILDKRLGSLNELAGMLGFIDTIDLYNKQLSQENALNRRSSSEHVYRDFLIYSNFYAAETPVVICEGETDNVYLTHAIRSLAAEFPELAEVKNGKIQIKVRLYKYPRSSAARILQLNDGGSSVLGKFIGTYRRETRMFTAPGQANPVVVLYDNDSGSKSIRSAIKENATVTIGDAEQFVRVVKNLYALPVPCVPGATQSTIEDCFSPITKATLIDGKTFNPSNSGIDSDKHYGKKVFAHQVIRPKADAIDFSGFRPLLTNLVALINAHKALVAAQS